MEVLNAMDLKKGKKADYNKMSNLTQPIQFLSKKNKNEEWSAWNMDWFEWQGLKQLKRNSRRLLKNYKLANGIIDKSDYIVEDCDDNEYSDIIQQLTTEDAGALELKFYPIIPNVINTLCNEFSKRNTKLTYRSVDELSYNEMMEEKKGMIEKTLVGQATMKMQAKMMEQGINVMEDQEANQKMQEEVKSLPQIEEFFRTDYRSIVEEWAQHQYEADMERFSMDELEERGFKDMLITDREFWHFKMYDDDYDVELWNPVLTFYHKSPDVRYISDGNWVGKVDMMSTSDVVDKYGWVMTQAQLESLEGIYPIRSAAYPIQGYQNDGSYYDATKSHDWNTQMPSLAYRQYVSMNDNFSENSGDIVSWILGESEDFLDFRDDNLLRVTTCYWKSQRKYGSLTKIDETGDVTKEFVDESYIITDKPIHNTTLFKNKTADNLVFGEFIEWIWLNEVWGGLKIGPNHGSFWGMNNAGGVDPMYLGINQNKIGRIKFQFKGDKTKYGSKLPVEGRVFTDRNSRSVSCVDQMKPWQIGYNMVNNQIADILIDELGTVIAFDQNALPRHSMGEDWGKNNYGKAWVAMKDFQMLPLDTTITNTENPLSMQHFQVLDMQQTARLMSRVELANYFKMQAFDNIGVSPQRMGQQIEQNTAEGVRAAVNGSYAQTEQYFIQHSDQLMPRVHSMRTDLAQFYQSTKPSVRLQYLTSAHEKINFQINGTDLMLRDLNVFATTKANHRAVMEKLRQLAIENNTSGASIYDLGGIIKADSIPEITDIMKKAEQKVEAQRQQEQQHQQQLQEQGIKAAEKEKSMERDYEAMEAEKDRRNDVLIAEIKASGFGAMMDIDGNEQSDFEDSMEDIRKTEQYDESTSLQRDKESNRINENREKNAIEKDKLNVQRQISADKLKIAQENKNQYDKPNQDTKKKK
jgi:hypothetical protein